MSQRAPLPPTVQYLGIRLTVQCDDPRDLYHQPKDFFPQDKEGGVLIGRAVSCDLQLQNTGVSAMHCRIVKTEREYCLEDANSQGGTYVGRRKVVPGQAMALRDGDVLRVGPYSITFQRGLSSFLNQSSVGDALDSTVQLQSGQDFLSADGQLPPQIRVVKGRQKGKLVQVAEYDDVYIGRDETCSLRLIDDAMSRKHAVIRRDWSGVTIRDLNSQNGVSVNQRKIKPDTEISLQDGDQIALGLSILLFSDPNASKREAELKSIRIDSEGMNGATILRSDIPRRGRKKTAAPQPAPQPTPQPRPNVDIREPMSGKWRVQKETSTPSVQSTAAKPPVPHSVPLTAARRTPPQHPQKRAAQRRTHARQAMQGSSSSQLPAVSTASKPSVQPQDPAASKQKGKVGLIIAVSLAFVLVVVLAGVLIFLK